MTYRYLIVTMFVSVLSGFSFAQDAYTGATGQVLESGPECFLIAVDSVSVMQRPDSSAAVWGSLAPGDSVEVTGRTEDGWLGFDPGVAQAANIGSFRLRWIRGTDQIDLAGDIESVPYVWAPEPHIPYAMYYGEAQLYQYPDTLSTVIESLTGGFAAAVTGQTDGWYLLDLSNGSQPAVGEAWVIKEAVSINGDLDSIPVLEEEETAAD